MSNTNNIENVPAETDLSSMSHVNNTKTTTSTQGSRVKLELEQLRQQQLAGLNGEMDGLRRQRDEANAALYPADAQAMVEALAPLPPR